MVFGPSEYEKRFYAVVESVIGPTSELSTRSSESDHWLRGVFRGRPVRIGIATGDDGEPSGYAVGFELGGRPIAVLIGGFGRRSADAPPDAPTGDPAFDAAFRPLGSPREVVCAVLDAPTRAMLREHAGADPNRSVHTSDGHLFVYRSIPSERQADPGGSGVTAEELAWWVERALELADRLTASFDARRAELAREQGEPAAAAWVTAQGADVSARAAKRANVRMVLLVVVALGVLLLVLPVLGCLAFGAWGFVSQ